MHGGRAAAGAAAGRAAEGAQDEWGCRCRGWGRRPKRRGGLRGPFHLMSLGSEPPACLCGCAGAEADQHLEPHGVPENQRQCRDDGEKPGGEARTLSASEPACQLSAAAVGLALSGLPAETPGLRGVYRAGRDARHEGHPGAGEAPARAHAAQKRRAARASQALQS